MIDQVDDISLVWTNIGVCWVAEITSDGKQYAGKGSTPAAALRDLAEALED